jgi:Tfp pilus assembly protein PilF
MSVKRFIERWRCGALWLAAGALTGLLSACHFVPERTAAPVAATGDPYLHDRPAVPAAAQADFDAAVAALRAQRWPEAEPKLQQLAERFPQLSGPSLNLALGYAQSEQPELAERHFQRAIEANPNNRAARNQYGIWLREQGRFRESEAAYLQALVRWPDHADSHLNLGVLYELYLGRLPEALQHYQRYLQLRGTETPVQGWAAELQRRLQSAG